MKKTKKKILVVNAISLFPTYMMSQQRALDQIYTLAKEHEVDVLTFNKNDEQSAISEKKIKGHINKYIALKTINNDEDLISKYYYNIKFLAKYYLLGIRREVSKYSTNYYTKSIINIINKHKYDVVISHYWWFSLFFTKHLKYNPLRVLDLHAMVEEDIELNDNNVFYKKNRWQEKRKNQNNLKFQKKVYKNVDLIVPNSINQVMILQKEYPKTEYYYCPNGQNLDHYKHDHKDNYDKDTILFYGSLGSLQNINAFKYFYNNVWPIVLEKNKNSKILIVGNNPPEWIKELNSNPNITITGFVEDVRQYISKACCMVLPMDIGVGFRGRVIEVMALGVPVIGNHNALDCIELENEINGFVTDDYKLMAKYTLKLMSDNFYREKISNSTVKFVNEKYSIDSTYGKLSDYIAST